MEPLVSCSIRKKLEWMMNEMTHLTHHKSVLSIRSQLESRILKV